MATITTLFLTIIAIVSPCAERHAQADLARPLRHRIRQHTVDAERRQQQRRHANDASSVVDRRGRNTARARICSIVLSS